jgi:hypothetical protein
MNFITSELSVVKATLVTGFVEAVSGTGVDVNATLGATWRLDASAGPAASVVRETGSCLLGATGAVMDATATLGATPPPRAQPQILYEIDFSPKVPGELGTQL